MDKGLLARFHSGESAMPDGPATPSPWGYYWALAQVGFEMAVPIAIGMSLDHHFGWAPWAGAAGALLGFVGGLAHLIFLLRRLDPPSPTQRRDPQ
jgi:hypothetical protein